MAMGIGADRLTLWRSLAALAGPMIVAESVGFLAQLGIVAVLGAMGGDALYLRSLYQPIGLVLLALTVAFGVSCQVAAAISKGSGQTGEVLSVVASFARVWFAAGLAVCLVVGVAAPGLADLVDVPAGQVHTFVWFLRLTSTAGLLLIAPALLAGCLRGNGYVREAMVVSAVAAVTNLAVVAALGLGAGLGLVAVPIAEVVSGVVGLVLGLLALRRVGLWGQNITTWRPMVWSLLRSTGLPVATTFLLLAAYSAAVILLLGRYGEDAVAGFSVASTVQNVVLLPATMLGAAIAILVNQQRGAGRFDQIAATVRGGLELSTVVFAVLAVLAWVAARPLVGFLAQDGGIAAQAAAYLGVVAFTYVLQGPVLVSLTVMEHTGGGTRAVLLNAVYFGLIVLAAALFGPVLGGADGFYKVVALCNLIGVSVPLFALRYARDMSLAAGPVPA